MGYTTASDLLNCRVEFHYMNGYDYKVTLIMTNYQTYRNYILKSIICDFYEVFIKEIVYYFPKSVASSEDVV